MEKTSSGILILVKLLDIFMSIVCVVWLMVVLSLALAPLVIAVFLLTPALILKILLTKSKEDKNLEMTHERQILLKIISKLSDREKKLLLDSTINNIATKKIEVNLDYNKKIYMKNRKIDKIRVMYSKINIES